MNTEKEKKYKRAALDTIERYEFIINENKFKFLKETFGITVHCAYCQSFMRKQPKWIHKRIVDFFIKLFKIKICKKCPLAPNNLKFECIKHPTYQSILKYNRTTHYVQIKFALLNRIEFHKTNILCQTSKK